MLGYGFLFVGASVPYLIEHLFGPTSALIVTVVFAIVGVCFLWAGHNCRLQDPAPISAKRKVFSALLAAAVIFTICNAGWHVYIAHRIVETSAPQRPTIVVQPPPTINQTATGSDCSNLVAGSNARVGCEANKERNEKDKNSH
jgi:multisubunit Na+/H+ antiporter MnhE subunit